METVRKTVRAKEKFVTFDLTQAVKIRNGVTLLMVTFPGLHVLDQARIVGSNVSSNRERLPALRNFKRNSLNLYCGS